MTAAATWYYVGGDSDFYWRVIAPAKAIGAKVVEIPDEGGFFAVTQENDDTAFPWYMHEDGVEYPAQEGKAAVWTRPDLARATHARAMRELHGIRTVCEVDDNYLGNPRLNMFMRANGFGPRERLQHLKACASMGHLIVTTNALRDIYWKAMKQEFGRALVPPIHVCGNHLFLEDWPQRIERDGPLRVGWMGSPSHVWDVDLAWAAMLHAHNQGCETIMVGYNPADPADFTVESKRSLHKTKQWGKAVSRAVGWEKMDGTSRLALPFDIGLCPLLHNAFTVGKSDIKAVEYTIAGAAVVASATSVYTENWIHGETALLASSPQEMLEHVDLLIRKTSLREELVRNAQQYVREERDITKHASEWREAVCGDSADLQGVRPADRQVAVGAQRG